jgi:hypothetical protein
MARLKIRSSSMVMETKATTALATKTADIGREPSSKRARVRPRALAIAIIAVTTTNLVPELRE